MCCTDLPERLVKSMAAGQHGKFFLCLASKDNESDVIIEPVTQSENQDLAEESSRDSSASECTTSSANSTDRRRACSNKTDGKSNMSNKPKKAKSLSQDNTNSNKTC